MDVSDRLRIFAELLVTAMPHVDDGRLIYFIARELDGFAQQIDSILADAGR